MFSNALLCHYIFSDDAILRGNIKSNIVVPHLLCIFFIHDVVNDFTDIICEKLMLCDSENRNGV